MKKILLFTNSFDENWVGGMYYLKSMAFQASQSEYIKKHYRIVVLTCNKYKSLFNSLNCDDIKVVSYNENIKYLGKIYKLVWYSLASCIYPFVGGGRLMELFSGKGIFWIPDFQEISFPQYFTDAEIIARKDSYTKIDSNKQPLVLSSQSSKSDFINAYDKCNKENVYVVPFVSAIENEVANISDKSIAAVKEKFEIKNKYIMVANQFWQHKNHIVVFKMIKKAQDEGLLSDVDFVFTGLLKDYRNPSYFEELKELIDSCQNKDQIKILGFISREEQLVLMSGSEFLIQPSLFEGWGTVVEDGKVLDKRIVLSDIDIHREQKNEKCSLFNPYDENDLLEVVLNELKEVSVDDINSGIERMHIEAKSYSKNFEKMISEMDR